MTERSITSEKRTNNPSRVRSLFRGVGEILKNIVEAQKLAGYPTSAEVIHNPVAVAEKIKASKTNPEQNKTSSQ